MKIEQGFIGNAVVSSGHVFSIYYRQGEVVYYGFNGVVSITKGEDEIVEIRSSESEYRSIVKDLISNKN